MTDPVVFDEFFDSGLEESVSPFLTPRSRSWGKHLPLKASITSAILLAIAFGLSLSAPLLPIAYSLLILVYFLAGTTKLINALQDILALEINIDVLMTLAAFLSVLIGSAMEGGLLLVLFAISGSIEETVTYKAKSAIRALHKLAPTKALVVEADGRTHERSIRDVNIGTLILIKAGEVIPLDGEVVEGDSALNLAHLSGESLPIKKGPGDEVPAGATNLDGVLTVKVTHASSDSTLSRIIRLITQAQEAKPRFQRFLDKVGRTYAMSIIGLSFLFAICLPFITNIPYIGYEGSVYRALAFLIAASPCALIIALPVAYLSALSSCARRGILLKGGITLDAVASCRLIAFDKTGTLTTGQIRALGCEPYSEDALAVAFALERAAVHPVAEAIVTYAQEKGVKPATITAFRAIPGYGLEGRWNDKPVYIGHPDYLDRDIEMPRQEGELLSVLQIGDDLYYFRFQDQPREGISETLQALQKETGLRPLMLTGDHHANAKMVAEKIGIEEFYADLRPEDKLEHVARLSQEEGLAMVGDGINDAPALARATAGISMGKVGSRTAIDASDVVLLQDNLSLLSWLWSKAHSTQVVVRQNVSLAAVAIVGASISALFGIVPLWLAVLLHEGGTVLVGLNSLRLLKK